MRTTPKRKATVISGVGNVQTAMVGMVEVRPIEGWLDMNQACAYLGCGKNSIYNMMARKLLPERKLNGTEHRFRREDLDKCILSPVDALNKMSKS